MSVSLYSIAPVCVPIYAGLSLFVTMHHATSQNLKSFAKTS